MTLTINIILDPVGATDARIQTWLYACAYLGIDDHAGKLRDILDQRQAARDAEKTRADPQRTVCPGIWRTRDGNLYEVRPNDAGKLDGLPWLVKDHYTVNDAGYVNPGKAHDKDLMEQVA